MMALKEHVKARYRLSDSIRAQKNEKMTGNLYKWIRTVVKEKGDLEEGSYKTLSQFYREWRSLLYHLQEKRSTAAISNGDLIRSHDQMGHHGIDKVQQKNTAPF